MGEHVVVHVDRLEQPPNTAVSAASSSVERGLGGGDDVEGREDEPLLQQQQQQQGGGGDGDGECRICQEEDQISALESPCACTGSLKYAHRKCVQRWCNEKGDIICEICHQPYQPGYTAPPPPSPHSEDAAIDLGGGWTISGTPLDLHDPRLLAIAEAERQFLEAEYDDYAASSASGAAFCRSAALIVSPKASVAVETSGNELVKLKIPSPLMALLLLRHAWTVPDADTDGDDDMSAFFSLFLLRAAGFLLPCYIMAWAISILQRRRQRQEAAALAATQVAFVLQSGQRRGLQFTIAPRSPTSLAQEPV